MSIVKRLSLVPALALALLATTLFSTTADALQIPGLRPPFQDLYWITHEVKVRHHVQGPAKRTMTITGRGDLMFGAEGPIAATVVDGRFTLTAAFEANARLTGGVLMIQGAIPEFGIFDDDTVLVAADLEAFGFDPLQPMLIGFNTVNTVCDPGLMDYLQSDFPEPQFRVDCLPGVVYIELDSAFEGLNVRQATTGFATTSVLKEIYLP